MRCECWKPAERSRCKKIAKFKVVLTPVGSDRPVKFVACPDDAEALRSLRDMVEKQFDVNVRRLKDG